MGEGSERESDLSPQALGPESPAPSHPDGLRVLFRKPRGKMSLEVGSAGVTSQEGASVSFVEPV